MDVKDWALFILRVAIGVTFVIHGYPKLFPSGPGGFAGFVESLGFPAPGLLAWVVALTEFGGGLAMLAGIFVRYAGALIAIEMAVTTTWVKMGRGVEFISREGTGWELDFVLFALALGLALLGAGRFSLDAVLKSRRSH
jgi:putative oxidoreductase